MTLKKIKLIVLCAVILALNTFGGCSPVDEDYGVSSSAPQNTSTASYSEDVVIPTIKSSDTVMPLYLDISLYDEENYSQRYLGRNFEFTATYAGYGLSVPTEIKTLNKKGWSIAPNQNYSDSSSVKAGLMLEIEFVNTLGIKLTAFFYNDSQTSVALKDCKIVRLAIEENTSLTGNSEYGLFSVNSINNRSAITDVMEILGPPSHFHADSKTDYTLNWFKYAEDRRNKITVSINTEHDCVTYIAISDYE